MKDITSLIFLYPGFRNRILHLQFILYGLINFSLPSSFAKADSYQLDKNEICLTSLKVIILHTLFLIQKECLYHYVYVVHA